MQIIIEFIRSSQWFWQCFTGIAQILSTLLVFFTLLEMQKERDCSYRPDIIIMNTTLMIERDGDINNVEDLSQLEAIISKYANSRCSTEVFNIGVGSAKNITITVIPESITSLIKHIKEKCIPGFSITEDRHGYDNKKTSGSIAKLVLTNNISYLCPQKENSANVDVLQIIEWIIGQITYEDLSEEEITEFYTEKIPPIQIIITYYDMQGVMYEKHYDVNFKFGTIQISNIDNKPDEKKRYQIRSFVLDLMPMEKKTNKKRLRHPG